MGDDSAEEQERRERLLAAGRFDPGAKDRPDYWGPFVASSAILLGLMGMMYSCLDMHVLKDKIMVSLENVMEYICDINTAKSRRSPPIDPNIRKYDLEKPTFLNIVRTLVPGLHSCDFEEEKEEELELDLSVDEAYSSAPCCTLAFLEDGDAELGGQKARLEKYAALEAERLEREKEEARARRQSALTEEQRLENKAKRQLARLQYEQEKTLEEQKKLAYERVKIREARAKAYQVKQKIKAIKEWKEQRRMKMEEIRIKEREEIAAAEFAIEEAKRLKLEEEQRIKEEELRIKREEQAEQALIREARIKERKIIFKERAEDRNAMIVERAQAEEKELKERMHRACHGPPPDETYKTVAGVLISLALAAYLIKCVKLRYIARTLYRTVYKRIKTGVASALCSAWHSELWFTIPAMYAKAWRRDSEDFYCQDDDDDDSSDDICTPSPKPPCIAGPKKSKSDTKLPPKSSKPDIKLTPKYDDSSDDICTPSPKPPCIAGPKKSKSDTKLPPKSSEPDIKLTPKSSKPDSCWICRDKTPSDSSDDSGSELCPTTDSPSNAVPLPPKKSESDIKVPPKSSKPCITIKENKPPEEILPKKSKVIPPSIGILGTGSFDTSEDKTPCKSSGDKHKPCVKTPKHSGPSGSLIISRSKIKHPDRKFFVRSSKSRICEDKKAYSDGVKTNNSKPDVGEDTKPGGGEIETKKSKPKVFPCSDTSSQPNTSKDSKPCDNIETIKSKFNVIPKFDIDEQNDRKPDTSKDSKPFDSTESTKSKFNVVPKFDIDGTNDLKPDTSKDSKPRDGTETTKSKFNVIPMFDIDGANDLKADTSKNSKPCDIIETIKSKFDAIPSTEIEATKDSQPEAGKDNTPDIETEPKKSKSEVIPCFDVENKGKVNPEDGKDNKPRELIVIGPNKSKENLLREDKLASETRDTKIPNKDFDK